MIIYQSKLGIKIVGKSNDYNDEMEREESWQAEVKKNGENTKKRYAK